METTDKIWFDGRFIGWDQAKIHVLTNSLHYGCGVYEGIRCYKTEAGGAVFRLDKHIDRLFYSAQCLGMKFGYSKDDIKEAVISLIKINNIEEGYIRPIAFYGYGTMGIDVSKAPVNIAIAVWPWGAYYGQDGVRVNISKFRRLNPESVIMDAKITGYYANSIFAKFDAKKAGADEALLLDGNGFIAEGPGENIFMVKNGQIYTPTKGYILPGITRDSVRRIAKNLRLKVAEKKITVQELKKADEIFFTGTAVEVCPVIMLDGQRVGSGKPGPITMKMRERYNNIIRGRDKKYSKWLTPIN